MGIFAGGCFVVSGLGRGIEVGWMRGFWGGGELGMEHQRICGLGCQWGRNSKDLIVRCVMFGVEHVVF